MINEMSMKIHKFLMLTLLTILSTAQSATHPLTGSSLINRPSNASAFSQMGFKVTGIPDFWVFNKSLTGDNKMLEVGFQNRTLLSFRMESVPAKTQLENYVRQYLRDYNQYGFEVAGLQSLKRNDSPMVIVDLKQKNKAMRSRQVFFHKGTKLIVATCTDDSSHFDATVQICNNVLGSFEWRAALEPASDIE